MNKQYRFYHKMLHHLNQNNVRECKVDIANA